MTSAVRDGHPDPEELDLLLEAEPGDPRRADLAGLRAHVDGCGACRDLVDQMRQVRELLRAQARHVPAPPEDLDDRIAAALARARTDDEPRPDPGYTEAGTVVPLTRRARVPRWLSVAAGLVVLGGAATTATQLLGPGGVDTAAVLGADTRSGESAAGGAQDAVAPVVSTGTDYSPEGLGTQVGALLDRAEAYSFGATAAEGGRVTPLGVPQAPAGDARLATPAGLAGCLEAIGAGGAQPRAVDLARWQGRDAAVIVLPGSAGRVEVWVVGRGCRPGADELLQYQSVSP